MRNYIVLLLLLLLNCNSTSSTVEKKEIQYADPETVRLVDVKIHLRNVETGYLKPDDFTSLKNYLLNSFDKNLDSLNYLTISYYRPKSLCWYNNYGIIKNADKKFLEQTKSKLNSEFLVLHHDSGYGSFYSFHDSKKIVYNLFDRDYQVCDFTITINKLGYYFYKASHFDVDVANAFKNELEIAYPID